MRALVLHPVPEAGRALARALENLDEHWQADWCSSPSAVHPRLICEDTALLLIAGHDSLWAALQAHPPVPSPWVMALGTPPCADCTLPADTPPQQAAALALRMAQQKELPLLGQAALPRLNQLAEQMLREMGLRRELRAAAFLPEAAALCAAYPPFLQALTGALYPRIGVQQGLRPAAVERNIRSALESLWSSGSLGALEKWFGHTVDPEKGRPTNREFLAMTAEHLRRLYRAPGTAR